MCVSLAAVRCALCCLRGFLSLAMQSQPGPTTDSCTVAASLGELRALLHKWKKSAPKQLEVAAFVKDVFALLACAVPNPCSLTSPAIPAQSLVDLRLELETFLRKEALPMARTSLRVPRPVVSPYAGAVDEADLLHRLGRQDTSHFTTREFRTACLNPGRVGLSSLGTAEVLYWRVWAIGMALQQEGVHVCVLLGARFPSGARLPDDFPYVWVGRQTSTYASVGFLVQAELAHAVQSLD